MHRLSSNNERSSEITIESTPNRGHVLQPPRCEASGYQPASAYRMPRDAGHRILIPEQIFTRNSRFESLGGASRATRAHSPLHSVYANSSLSTLHHPTCCGGYRSGASETPGFSWRWLSTVREIFISSFSPSSYSGIPFSQSELANESASLSFFYRYI